MASKREPNSVTVTPSGIEIAFWDSIGVHGEPQKRRYKVNGEGYISATTILGVLHKNLAPAAVKLTLEGLDYKAEWKAAGERGTAIHDLLLRLLAEKGKVGLADVPDEYRAYGQAAFRWLLDREPVVDLIETMVASPKHMFAGRVDLVARIDGTRTLIDWKTTDWKTDAKGRRYAPYPENALQLDLYQQALDESGYETAERGLIVRLGPDGTYDETFTELDPERGLAILEAKRAKDRAGKAMRAAA